jgi:hypothetical protein
MELPAMIDPSDPGIASLLQRLFEQMHRSNADRRGHFVADLTALSFLIDSKIATFEQVCERLRQVQQSLPPDYQLADVSERTNFLAGVLTEVYGRRSQDGRPK